MLNLTYFKDHFKKLQDSAPDSPFVQFRAENFRNLDRIGLPTKRNEDWKYTAINELFDNNYRFGPEATEASSAVADISAVKIPGHLQANEIVFLNGSFVPELSSIRSSPEQLIVLPLLEAATGDFKNIVSEYLGCSNPYFKDGIHALNSSFIHGGVFIQVTKGQRLSHPIYIYYLTDTQLYPVLSQPRSLLYIGEGAKACLVETHHTLGGSEGFTNQVMEVVTAGNSIFEYYKIQDDVTNASQVSSTHIRQISSSYLHAVTVSLGGGLIRNNLNVVMDAAGNEAHLFGLYMLDGKTHVDNHTLVNHAQPNCLSNELYKGVLAGQSTGVFNGKIMVRPDAQKTNAYQTNKNILLSDGATVNSKPQLEIFADDVKCSHGCTVGQLDKDAFFYLRARGISKQDAQQLLISAFATDVLEQIKPGYLRDYVKQLVENHLTGNENHVNKG